MGAIRKYTPAERELIYSSAQSGLGPARIVEIVVAAGYDRSLETIRASIPYKLGRQEYLERIDVPGRKRRVFAPVEAVPAAPAPAEIMPVERADRVEWVHPETSAVVSLPKLSCQPDGWETQMRLWWAA